MARPQIGSGSLGFFHNITNQSACESPPSNPTFHPILPHPPTPCLTSAHPFATHCLFSRKPYPSPLSVLYLRVQGEPPIAHPFANLSPLPTRHFSIPKSTGAAGGARHSGQLGARPTIGRQLTTQPTTPGMGWPRPTRGRRLWCAGQTAQTCLLSAVRSAVF